MLTAPERELLRVEIDRRAESRRGARWVSLSEAGPKALLSRYVGWKRRPALRSLTENSSAFSFLA